MITNKHKNRNEKGRSKHKWKGEGGKCEWSTPLQGEAKAKDPWRGVDVCCHLSLAQDKV